MFKLNGLVVGSQGFRFKVAAGNRHGNAGMLMMSKSIFIFICVCMYGQDNLGGPRRVSRLCFRV